MAAAAQRSRSGGWGMLRGDHERARLARGLTALTCGVLLRPAAAAAGIEQHQVRQAGR
jgi:hypothetical protein